MSHLTPEEREVVEALAKAWDKFVLLPLEHADDIPEFRRDLHRLQLMVLARPGRREINGHGA